MKTLKDKQFLGEKAVTAAQMKEIERRADQAGLSYYQMMENAGTRASEFIAEHHSVAGQKVLILCGRGNNGGDGFVVARKLNNKGARVTIALLEGEPTTPDSIENYRLCKELNIPVLSGAGESDAILSQVKTAEIIVDGIFGTGFHGILGEKVRKVTEQINISIASVYALDIPSGVNGDSGEADIDSIRADYTLSFHRMKPAHTMMKAIEYCGDVVCLSIGIEEVLKEERHQKKDNKERN